MRSTPGGHPGRAGVRLQGAFFLQIISFMQHPFSCASHQHTILTIVLTLRWTASRHSVHWTPLVPHGLRVSACMRCRARPRLIQPMWTRIWGRHAHWVMRCCAAWPYLGRSVSSSTQARLLQPFWNRHDCWYETCHAPDCWLRDQQFQVWQVSYCQECCVVERAKCCFQFGVPSWMASCFNVRHIIRTARIA